jgi:hypothetical protein
MDTKAQIVYSNVNCVGDLKKIVSDCGKNDVPDRAKISVKSSVDGNSIIVTGS